jgi:predicted RNase H-like HicB family nuclease
MNKPGLRSIIYREGAYYVAQCLDVEISSFGRTESHARSSLQEALELYFA